MKNKGVFLAIIIILVVGVSVTIGTRNVLTDRRAQFPELIMEAETDPSSPDSSALDGGGRDLTAPDQIQRQVGRDRQAEQAAPPDPGGQEGDFANQEDPGNQGSSVNQENSVNQRSSVNQESTANSAKDQGGAGSLKNDSDKTAPGTDLGAAPAAGAKPEYGYRSAPVNEDNAELPSDGTDGMASGKGRMIDSPPISPVTGSAANSKTESSSVSRQDYETQLKAVDDQIQKMRESGIVPNTDTCKNMAEYEYRLWDSKLNAIYSDIQKNLTDEEAKALKDEERSWMKQRDEAAGKAASKHKGGAVETTEYTASLAESTRARAYQLLKDYGDYLPETDSDK